MPTCPPILRTVTEFNACVPADVAKLFWARAQQQRGLSWVLGQQNALRAGAATIESAYVFQLVPVVSAGPAAFQLVDGQMVFVGALEEARPRSLSEANWFYAQELCSEMPRALLDQLADGLGVRRDVPEVELRGAVALLLAGLATRANILLPEAVDFEAIRAGAGASGSFWGKFSSGWKKLWSNPGEWARRVFITEPGKALEYVGRQILSVTTHKWLRWVFDPLQIASVFGVFLQELGYAAIDGSISTFNEQRFALTVADHWRQVGQALAVAAPFLPPPWNIAAAALAAVFTAAGVALQRVYQQAEAARDAEQAEAEAAAVAQAAQQRLAMAQANAEHQQQIALAAAHAAGVAEGQAVAPAAENQQQITKPLAVAIGAAVVFLLAMDRRY